jgi:site-specific recombinase XerD
MKGRALSKGELAALFEACNPTTAGGARNAALLGLLYGGGLRRAEVVALDLGDFDTETGKLVVRGKGNKERAAWVTTALAKLSMLGSCSGATSPVRCSCRSGRAGRSSGTA